MKLHKKILSWVVDYGYMIHGSVTSLIYHKPPKHYLDYVLENKVPVILVPGILGKWGFMKTLGDKISLAGHPVYIVPELGYNLFKIPDSTKKLRDVIEKIDTKKDNLKGVILIAHSKGGLIGKYLLAHQNQDNKVLGLISVATPFSGSSMAKLLPLDSIQELNTDSKIILDLEKHTEVNNKIISICPEYDNHVWAEKGSYLDGAKNIGVNVHGHHKVIFDKNVEDIVLKYIEEITLQN